MIDEIEVKNVASIANASLEPASNMTVITGETGAGKTALLSAMKMMMGQRVGRDAVKDGAAEAEVTGRLVLRDNPDEVVVHRQLSSEGRSRVRIDGRMASVSELSDAVSPTISLSSQHDQVLLTKPQTQRDYLDVWCQADSDGLLSAYRAAFQDASDARQHLKDIESASERSAAEIEEAHFRLSKIDAISPDQADYDELISSVRKAENIEMLARTTGEARSSLSDEGGVLDGLNAAIALIEDASRADDFLSKNAETLRSALYAVEDVARDIAGYNSAIDMDETMLGVMQDRIAAYQSLMRSYGPTIEDVIKSAEEARQIIDSVDDSQRMIEDAKKQLDACEANLVQTAEALSARRQEGALSIGKAVSENLARLHMKGSEFVCEVTPLARDEWNESGADEIRFKLRPAANMQLRELARIASGGELSRTMLALHAALGDRDAVETLVFDEVDAGVGGEAAESVGELLHELSNSHQVIVVTHLAQIASLAHRHFVASKSEEGGLINTTITEVSGEDRVDEIARMLSGSRTQESIAHANALLSR